MNKTYLLLPDTGLSNKATKTLMGIVVLTSLFQSTNYLLIEDNPSVIEVVIGIAFLPLCALFSFRIFTEFSEKSEYANSIQLTDKSLSIKSQLFKKRKTFEADSIQSIHFRSFIMQITTTKGKQQFKLHIGSNRLNEVKAGVRKYAEAKGIDFSSGKLQRT